MKINLIQIPQAGLELREVCPPEQLELDSKDIKFKKPIQILAWVSKGFNAVTVETNLLTEAEATCSRCLSDFTLQIDKKHRFSYQVSQEQPDVDISEDIRQEIILSCPIKLLCKPDCKGLCPKCGNNLNIGSCKCQMKPKLMPRTECH